MRYSISFFYSGLRLTCLPARLYSLGKNPRLAILDDGSEVIMDKTTKIAVNNERTIVAEVHRQQQL